MSRLALALLALATLPGRADAGLTLEFGPVPNYYPSNVIDYDYLIPVGSSWVAGETLTIAGIDPAATVNYVLEGFSATLDGGTLTITALQADLFLPGTGPYELFEINALNLGPLEPHYDIDSAGGYGETLVVGPAQMRSVPEPASALMAAVGLLAVGLAGYRRR